MTEPRFRWQHLLQGDRHRVLALLRRHARATQRRIGLADSTLDREARLHEALEAAIEVLESANDQEGT